MEITTDFLQPYLQGLKKHKNYDSTTKLYKELKVHADGETPDDLLMARRPGESQTIFKYRKDIYQPKTKMVFNKILNSLAKISRSVDWNIDYSKNVTTGVGSSSLQEYCDVDYPKFGNLTNWMFAIGLKQYLIDPNAVVLVRMNDIPQPNELPGPVMEIFNSDQVYDFVERKYAVLLSTETATYTVDNITHTDGKIFYVVTPEEIVKFSQNNLGATSWIQESTIHNMGVLSCFKLGGLVKESGQEFLYESRINGCVPSLNSAIMIYSDKQAEMVQHVHSLMWQYQTQKCKKCSGSGFFKPNMDAAPLEVCTECNGNGTVPTSPYESMVINANTTAPGDNPVPIPLAGYIQKNDVATMLKAIDESYDGEIYDAYAAVSMEFLADSPFAQSGIAKAVDRDELNNFVHSVATDLVHILRKCYWHIAMMRYSYTVKDAAKIKAMCPNIAVPQKFDLLSDTFIIDEIAKLRNAQVDPVIVAALEAEYNSKKFKDNDELVDLLNAVYSLNPFPGVNTADLMTRLTNGGIEILDYIISCYIFEFVKTAVDQNKGFYTMPREKQKDILKTLAQEKQDEITGEAKLKAELMKAAAQEPNPGNAGGGTPDPSTAK